MRLILSDTEETEATSYGKQYEKDALHKLEQMLGVEIIEPKQNMDK